MGKGEIAHYEQFLLFLQCFHKACFPGASKGVIMWEWVKKTCSLFLVKVQFSFFFFFLISPLPKGQISDSFSLKISADYEFEICTNSVTG